MTHLTSTSHVKSLNYSMQIFIRGRHAYSPVSVQAIKRSSPLSDNRQKSIFAYLGTTNTSLFISTYERHYGHYRPVLEQNKVEKNAKIHVNIKYCRFHEGSTEMFI